jgi:hypothetical protein
MAWALSKALADTLTGGKRTESSATKRVSGEARPLLTRTSPDRMMR